jgi:transglutaminase-like putative cysteine protease
MAPADPDTIRLRVGCTFRYEVGALTPAVIQVAVDPGSVARVVNEKWDLRPAQPMSTFADLYGNLNRRTVLGRGPAEISYDATVEVPEVPDPSDDSARQDRVEDLPAEVLHFLLASRYIESDALSGDAWQLFGDTTPGWARAQAICTWVNRNLTFDHSASNWLTTARDAFNARKGVCRDFAQLFVAFCRAMAIPARYVFGYLPDVGVEALPIPMDFYGWAEVYLGGRWWTFDPRNDARRIGRVVIGRGRDAVDVAMVTTWGPARFQQLQVWAAEVEAAEVKE